MITTRSGWTSRRKDFTMTLKFWNYSNMKDNEGTNLRGWDAVKQVLHYVLRDLLRREVVFSPVRTFFLRFRRRKGWYFCTVLLPGYRTFSDRSFSWRAGGKQVFNNRR